MPYAIDGFRCYSPRNKCCLAYGVDRGKKQGCQGTSVLSAGNTSHYVLWQELALLACARCARTAKATQSGRDVLRRDFRVHEIVEELESTVLPVEFDGLSAAMQSALRTLKAAQQKLR
jgi:hypothetical protein